MSESVVLPSRSADHLDHTTGDTHPPTCGSVCGIHETDLLDTIESEIVKNFNPATPDIVLIHNDWCLPSDGRNTADAEPSWPQSVDGFKKGAFAGVQKVCPDQARRGTARFIIVGGSYAWSTCRCKNNQKAQWGEPKSEAHV
jgi:hypothetical protein